MTEGTGVALSVKWSMKRINKGDATGAWDVSNAHVITASRASDSWLIRVARSDIFWSGTWPISAPIAWSMQSTGNEAMMERHCNATRAAGKNISDKLSFEG